MIHRHSVVLCCLYGTACWLLYVVNKQTLLSMVLLFIILVLLFLLSYLKMKINCKELEEISYGESSIEGRLHYKKTSGHRSHTGFKEKWFKLRLNVLFYYNLSDTGTVVSIKPLGGYILEQCSASLDTQAETPFSFVLHFPDENIIFSGRSEEHVKNWIIAINSASYYFLRGRLKTLSKEIYFLTGQEPILPFANFQCTRYKNSNDLKVDKEEQTFRSYLESNETATVNHLSFHENHFGGNGSIGQDGLPPLFQSFSIHSASSAFDNKKPTASCENLIRCDVLPETSANNIRPSAIARPRPVRKAPDPPLPQIPIRPPRVQKNVPSTTPTVNNLIEL